jgi:hypothetical protein
MSDGAPDRLSLRERTAWLALSGQTINAPRALDGVWSTRSADPADYGELRPELDLHVKALPFPDGLQTFSRAVRFERG